MAAAGAIADHGTRVLADRLTAPAGGGRTRGRTSPAPRSLPPHSCLRCPVTGRVIGRCAFTRGYNLATSSGSQRVVYAALFGNFAVATTKFIAAALTGSSSMLSEGVHSLVDTGNGALLLYGMKRSQRRPDGIHPLGYGREVYFWSFMVALLLFSLGAGVSLYEGVQHVLSPVPMESPYLNYIVLGLSLVFEGGSWWVAFKEFRQAKGKLGYFEAVRLSKDPPSFLVLFEDSAALIGILIAFAGIAGAQILERPELDGVASIAIALVLGASASLVARESKGLLIGEQASPETVASILKIVEREPGVVRANGMTTVHMAPDQIVVSLSVEFADELRTPDIEERIAGMEERVRAAHPEVIALFVKPQTEAGFTAARRRRRLLA